MTEDEIYRTSSQFRTWSFTETSLANLRVSTNAAAAESVRAAIQASRHGQKSSSSNGSPGDILSPADVDCLSVEEEQRLVQFYCLRTIEFSDFCQFPTVVKATAIQYLKRFYLYNSPMTYHPKQMMPCAIYLATKTENHYQSLKSFASKLEKTTTEDVIAPEFLLTQGLRFTFDVRHPQRGLEGGYMELMAIVNGDMKSDGSDINEQDVHAEILKIASQGASAVGPATTKVMKARIQKAHDKAVETLKTAALLSDVYFLYTPSQIWLASMLCADEALTEFLIKTKTSQSPHLQSKLRTVVQGCAALLRSSISAQPDKDKMKELIGIDRKLYKCRNPEKVDLVAINKAQKRDGEGSGGDGLDEKTIKKRKVERESSMKVGEDLFGPSIS